METTPNSAKAITVTLHCQAGLPHVFSHDLLCGGRRLIIEHDGEQYCLRLTRNEKLILTKN